MGKDDLECGCLVIGSGPGGAVTASVLAQAGHDVLVLEEGMDGSAGFSPYSLDEMDNLCRYGGLGIIWGNTKISYMEGCCLGGASEINAGLYHRPSAQLFDQWEKEYRIQDFGAAAMGPFFEANEKALGIGTTTSVIGPGARIVERGAKNLNWESIGLSRMWDPSDIFPQGQRRSMSRSFIPEAKAAGAKFVLGVKVKKINFQGKKACEAVCVSSGDQKKYFRVAFKSVFVCGGAVQTPFLLRKSGLTHHIGDDLKIHLAVRLAARFDETASDPREGVPARQVAEFKPQMTLGGSFSSPAYLALWLAGRRDFARLMQSSSNLGLFNAYFSIKTHGRVRPDPFSGEAKILMDINDDDQACIGDAVYKLGQMLFAAGAKIVYSPIPGGRDCTSVADMEPLRHGAESRELDLSTLHLFSSCPMGEDKARCALDSFGRVHGKSNIYVNDASMLSDSPGTNPQALIMALARRNALHWLGHEGRRG